MLSSENKILIKTFGNLYDFLPEDSSRNTLTKIEKTNIGRLSVKVAQNQFDGTHCRKLSTPLVNYINTFAPSYDETIGTFLWRTVYIDLLFVGGGPSHGHR